MTKIKKIICLRLTYILVGLLNANEIIAAEPVTVAPSKEALIQLSSTDLLIGLQTQLKLRLGLTTSQIDALNNLTASYQQKLNGVPEEQLADRLNALIVESGIEGAEVINRHDPIFWLYRARFGINNPSTPAQIPVWLTRRGQGWYVYLAAAGSSKESRLKRGDQIEFNKGLPLNFEEPTAKTLNVKVKSLSFDKPQTAAFPLQQKSVSQLFLDLTQANRKVLVTGKTKTGVLLMPAIDLELLRVDVEQALKQFENSTDQLVVDLRGPYGGGGMTGLELFLDEKGKRVHYKKPLYLLIDRYTSGGRELLAGLLQRHAGAVLVGETTAGRTAPVELTELEPGKFILITEHKTKTAATGPISPDQPIAETLMFAAGQDKILDGALATISRK
jgi:hypothetical protein